MTFRIGSFKNEKCEQDYPFHIAYTFDDIDDILHWIKLLEYLINMLPQNCEMKTSSIIDSSIRKKSGIKTLCGLE